MQLCIDQARHLLLGWQATNSLVSRNGIGGLCAELWGVRAAMLIIGAGVLLSLAAGLLSSLPRAGTLGHVRAGTDIG